MPHGNHSQKLTQKLTLKSFVEQLEKDGIGSDGLTTKLERLEIAITYCCREGKLHLSSEDCCNGSPASGEKNLLFQYAETSVWEGKTTMHYSQVRESLDNPELKYI